MAFEALFLGLKHEEFWGRPDDCWSGLQAWEYLEWREAILKRKEYDEELLMHHCANILNVVRGIASKRKPKSITAKQLLGRDTEQQKEEQEKLLSALENEDNSSLKAPKKVTKLEEAGVKSFADLVKFQKQREAQATKIDL